VVDLEGELISSLEKIARLRYKKKKQKQLMIQFKKYNEKCGIVLSSQRKKDP
jgi:hypothetical protein